MQVLRNKNFILLFLGQTVSRMGSRLYNVALMWYIYQITGSSLALGISVLCFTIPTIIIEPFAGVLADNYDRKKIIVATDLLNGMIMIVFSYIIYTGTYPTYFLYIFLVLSTMVTAVFGPSIGSAIPMIVEKEELKNANSLNHLSGQLTNIFGPLLAGFLLAFMNVWGLIFLNGISFILSAISESFIVIPKAPKENQENESLYIQFKEGLRYVVTDKKLFYLVIAGGVVINVFLAPLSIYLTILATDILQVGSGGYGMINAAISVGAFLGAMLILTNLFKLFNNKYKLVIIALSIQGVGVMLLGVFNIFYFVLFAGAIVGLGVSMASVGISTLYQILIPKEKMGRAIALVSTLCNITVPLGTVLGSMIILYLPLKAVLIASGLFILITGIALIPILKEEERDTESKTLISQVN